MHLDNRPIQMIHNNSVLELWSIFAAPAAAETPICAPWRALTCQYLMCLVSFHFLSSYSIQMKENLGWEEKNPHPFPPPFLIRKQDRDTLSLGVIRCKQLSGLLIVSSAPIIPWTAQKMDPMFGNYSKDSFWPTYIHIHWVMKGRRRKNQWMSVLSDQEVFFSPHN